MNTKEFQKLTFNTFDIGNILLDDSLESDSNYFNTHGFSNTTYFTLETLKTMIKGNNDISFSVMTSHSQSSILISKVY